MYPLQEQFLLLRIKSFRDERAFEVLCREIRSGLYRFLRSKLPTDQDADDVYSITLLRLWSYLTSTHETKIGTFRGLTFHIGKNAVVDFYRSRKDTVSIDAMEEVGHTIADKKMDDNLIFAQADVALLDRALQRLSPEQRDLIIQHYMEGIEIHELAEQFEKTQNATRVALHRALKQLRKICEDSTD